MHIHRVDLKGKEHVPESVYHLVYDIDPVKDASWGAKTNLPTNEIHVAEVRQGQVCTHVCIGFAHVCVYVYVSVCLCLCIYIYICVCVCVCVCLCKIHRPVKDASWGAKTNLPTDEIHVTEVRQGQVCTHVYLVCVFLCMYECIYMCVYDM